MYLIAINGAIIGFDIAWDKAGLIFYRNTAKKGHILLKDRTKKEILLLYYKQESGSVVCETNLTEFNHPI